MNTSFEDHMCNSRGGWRGDCSSGGVIQFWYYRPSRIVAYCSKHKYREDEMGMGWRQISKCAVNQIKLNNDYLSINKILEEDKRYVR